MRILNLSEGAIGDFENNGKRRLSRPSGGNPAVLFCLTPEEQQLVDEYEEKCGVLIYHVLEHYIGEYRVYSFLFVDFKEQEKWKEEREELMKSRTELSCYARAYVEIPGMPEYKDFQAWDIEIRPLDGALMRMGV